MPLHHAGTQILKTKRLVLRPLSLDDAQAMYDNWASDPQVTRFMNWPTHENIEVTRAILAEWVPQYQNPSYYHWCITLDGEPIGAVSLLNIQERSMAGELGYNIGRKWWHQRGGAGGAGLCLRGGGISPHRGNPCGRQPRFGRRHEKVRDEI